MTSESNNNTNGLSTNELLRIEKLCDHVEALLRNSPETSRENVDELVLALPANLRSRARQELDILLADAKQSQRERQFQKDPPKNQGNDRDATEQTAIPIQTMELGDALPTPVRGNRFELHQKLGAGGAGTVWRAFDRTLGRWVALKAPHAESVADIERFLREARTVAKLQHPRIVRVLDTGRDDFGCFMVSELVDGVSLGEKLKHTSYSPIEAATLVSQIAEAVGYAHKHGIVHRDLKSHNILIDAHGQPFVTDFGLAKEWFHNEDELTRHGQIVGTPAFMAPEQAMGEVNQIETRTDIYALGVMLFQLLTGDLPFRGNVDSILDQVIHREAPSPRTLNRNVPVELEILCVKCMEKLPSQRLASAEFLRMELQRFIQHEPIVSKPISSLGRLKKFARRNPGPVYFGVLVSLMLISIVGISVVSAFVVAEGWSREFRLRIESELANKSTQQAIANETKALEAANEARLLAEAKSRIAIEEAALSQQSLQFLEGVIQSSDPVSWVLGSQLSTLKSTPKLSELLDVAAARVKSEMASQPRVQTRLMDTIANSYRGLGRFSEALQLLEQSKLIRVAAGLSNETSVQNEILRNEFYRGIIHQDLTEYADAETVYRHVLNACEIATNRDLLLEADVEFQFGWLLIAERKNSEAQTHFRRALAIREEHFAPNSNAIRAAMVGLEMSQSQNSGELSIDQLQSIVAGSDSLSRIASEYLAVLANRKLGNYDMACSIYSRIITELESQLSEQHPVYLLALGEYCDLLRRKGDFKLALPLVQKVISTAEAIAPNHVKLRDAREMFASELIRAQRFREAGEQLAKVLEYDKSNDRFSPSAIEASIWPNLLAGRSSDAIELATQLVNHENAAPAFKRAWYYYCQARSFDRAENREAAEYAGSESLRIADTVSELPTNPIWLERLSTIRASANDFDAAEFLIRSAVAQERAINPPMHPHTADRLNGLANVLLKSKKTSEAVAALSEALKIREATLPESDARITQTKKLLAELEVAN